MPRYVFHVRKNSHEHDNVAIDLCGVQEARREAVRLMGEELRFKTDEFWDDGLWEVEVTDDRGSILFAIHCTALRSLGTEQRS